MSVSESAELYTIGQAARRVGVPARTIRFWCDSGVLPPASRSAGGYRRYDAAAIARLDLVRTLRDLGLGLDDVRAELQGGISVAELAGAHAPRPMRRSARRGRAGPRCACWPPGAATSRRQSR